MEAGKDDKGAIDRVKLACFGTRVSGVNAGSIGADADIEKGVEAGHVTAHVTGPFQDLGADVDKEGVGGPSSEYHDFGGGDVGKEESHGGARADGFVANFMGFETKGGPAAKDGTSGSEGLLGKGAGDKEGCVCQPNGVDGGGGREVGDGSANALNDGAPAFDWAEDFLIHAALGAGILLVAVLLVFKDEGNEFGREKNGVGVGNDATASVPEDDRSEA